jgi:DNA primase
MSISEYAISLKTLSSLSSEAQDLSNDLMATVQTVEADLLRQKVAELSAEVARLSLLVEMESESPVEMEENQLAETVRLLKETLLPRQGTNKQVVRRIPDTGESEDLDEEESTPKAEPVLQPEQINPVNLELTYSQAFLSRFGPQTRMALANVLLDVYDRNKWAPPAYLKLIVARNGF